MDRYKKISLFIFFLVCTVFSVYATNYYTTNDGVFGTNSNWSDNVSPGTNFISKYNGGKDTVFVRNAMTVSTGFTVEGTEMVLMIESGGSITVTGSGYINGSQIIIKDGGLLDFSSGFSTANNAIDRITINGVMNVGGDINAAAGTWYVGASGALNVAGSIVNNDPDMNFTNEGSVTVGNNVDFQSGTWYMGTAGNFFTSGSNLLVGSADIVNDGKMKFENATNITTWDGSWDCDGAGSGSVAFAQNVNCATICSGGGSANCEANAVLPVEWLNFTAVARKNSVDILWSTASEKNNDFFVIERSLEGTEWTTVGTLDGAGNSNDVQNYIFEDVEINSDVYYYRIAQVDFDGRSEYSSIVFVEISDSEMTSGTDNSIYPNPTNGEFYILTKESKVESLVIYNLQKLPVNFSTEEQNNRLKVHLEDSVKGYLTAVIVTDKKVIQKNILVK